MRTAVGAFRSRVITETLRPSTVEEVQAAVRQAKGPLQPISTGFNWGLGSHQPVRDGAVLLDLAGLNRLRELDLDRGYAVIEPGVTQGDLATALHGTSRMPNLTTASMHTSIMGNTLERGVGIHRARSEDLVGLEVVLADGSLRRIGWWPGHSAAVRSHRRGPSAMHLFTQSGFAAVTAAVIRLLPRPERIEVVPLQCTPEEFPEAVDALREWTAQRLVPPTTKITNPVGAPIFGVQDHHLAHICLTGTAELVAAHRELLLKQDSPWRPAPDSAADDLVQRAYAGDPDPADSWFLQRIGCPAGQVDAERGLLMFLPVIPFRGEAAQRAAELIDFCRVGSTAPPLVTLNVLDSDTVNDVVILGFPLDDPQAVADAHATLDRLHSTFAAEGLMPYRLDIDHPEDNATDLIDVLGTALDPQGVFDPGRYISRPH
ncbi:FAD-binding oxidoreductase [Pseudonocardiaceae bacterium YIM PH 21723]|nr:FAD-binding oxidoreductase [Pseudonocardiaceae bacterium YIM PH 21723]